MFDTGVSSSSDRSSGEEFVHLYHMIPLHDVRPYRFLPEYSTLLQP